MLLTPGDKLISMEPILDFDMDIILSWMDQIEPILISIGADSKGHNLPEPPPEKVTELITELEQRGHKVHQKKNLARLKGGN